MIKLILGKTLILGDSYSTFEEYIPDGYKTWYTKTKEEKTDVNKVEQTWWYDLFDGKQNILLRNESYSGSSVCNTGWPNLPISTSFVSRFETLVKDGFFEENKIDTIIVFGYTNDCWVKAPLGELKFERITDKDLFEFLPAVCYLASRIGEVLPKTNVVWILNSDMNEEYPNGVIKVANHYNQKYIKLKEIDKLSGHPSVKGMKQIKEEIAKF